MAADGEKRIDPEAVEELYHQCATGLRAFLIGLLRDRELAEEVQQATFLKALQSGHQVDPERFRGWLFRVANNEALLVGRRRKVDRRAKEKIAGASPGVPEQPVVDSVSRTEMSAAVRQALEKLPKEQLEVVRLRIYEGLRFAEIAERTQVPLGTVLTRMRLALQRLSKALSDEYKQF